jgi:hypothetical protein
VSRNADDQPNELDDLARAWASADALDVVDADLVPAEIDGGADDPEPIWRAAAGESSPEEIQLLAQQAATDPRLALAWRLARELGAGSGEAGHALAGVAAVDRSLPARRGWRAWHVAATLAAALLLVAGLLLLVPAGPAPEPAWRNGESSARLLPEVEDGAFRPRAAFVLRWREAGAPHDPATRFSVRLTTADLRLVYEDSDFASPQATVPEEALAAWPARTTFYWQVEARLPDGRRITSPAVRIVLAD